MRDVADAAGVSIKTVSEVVNGIGSVRQSTREHVLAVIERLDYRPNPAARRLNAGRTGLVTFALPRLGNASSAALAAAMIAAAADRGIDVVVEPTDGDPDRELEVVQEAAGATDGVVLATANPSPAAGVMPIVLIGDGSAVDDAARVDVPLREAVAAGTALVRARGARHVLLLGAATTLDVDGVDLALPVDEGRDAAWVLATRLLAERPVDAVVALDDGIALGVLHAARDLGRRVPSDLQVVAIGVGVEAAYAVPSLTTVEEDVEEVAALALDRLLGLAADAPRAVAVPVRVVERESTRSSR